MPRLLLVDDNPSIHKIAETLLAPTDIQLHCVESAKEALALIAQGERFDVALIDTAMAETDGWELLNQFRMHPATAGIPIAMMAGVLDTVDPARLENAPIQGFLKKPVELRDLGDRVHKLLETRVEPPPQPPVHEASPFSTLPAVKLSDLPEFRKAAVPEPEAEAVPVPVPEASEDDLLLLTEADLWPEVPPPPGTVTEDLSPFAEIPPEESLDLEELDLDSLRGLTVEAAAPAPMADEVPVPAAPPFEIEATPGFEAEVEVEPEPELEPAAASLPAAEPAVPEAAFPEADLTQELPDLGPEDEPTFDPEALAALDALEETFPPLPSQDLMASTPDPDFLSGLGEASITPDVVVVDWMGERSAETGTPQASAAPGTLAETSDSGEDELDLGELAPIPMPPEPRGFPLAGPESESWIAGELPVLAAAAPAMAAPAPIMPTPEAPASVVAPAASEPAGSPEPGSAPAAEALLRAITADPALMDQLAKALVAKLSDQALREIAWEVMPEMAERLNRH
jgi:CheY-like chemotaxis protein